MWVVMAVVLDVVLCVALGAGGFLLAREGYTAKHLGCMVGGAAMCFWAVVRVEQMVKLLWQRADRDRA